MGETQGTTTTIDAPRSLPAASGTFVAVDIAVDIDAYPSWRRPVRAYFRKSGEQWTLVGLERLPEKLATASDTTRRERSDR
jgi:hypothetical protein